MKNTWAITKKELGAFFASPIAYVIIVVFSVLIGFFFYAIVSWFNSQALQMAQDPYYAQQININQQVYAPLFGNIVIILLLVLPLLTMRLFSEEKRSGTDELLFTSPVSLLQIALGKFISSLVVLAAMLLLSSFLSLFIFIHGNPELPPILIGYLGLFLTGAAFIAFGVFFSALTENQIVSAVLSFGTLLFFWIINWVSATVSGFLRPLFENISLLRHFDNMTAGTFDTQDLAYFLSLIVFALFMTNWILQSKWWRQNIEKLKGRFSLWAYLYFETLFLTAVARFIWAESLFLRVLLIVVVLGGIGALVLWLAGNIKQVLFWANKLLIVILVLGILGLANYLVARHPKRWDLTAAKIHSLSDQSIKVVKALKSDILLKAFFRDGNYGRGTMENLLKLYAYHSDHLKYEFIDPDKNPGLVKRYVVTQDGTTVLEASGQEARITTTSEEDLTNALIKVTRAQKKAIYFLEGHGEGTLAETGDNGYSAAKNGLEKLSYEVKTLGLALTARVPADCALLVVPGPQKDLLPNEYESIKAYIASGGRALFLVDPETQTLLPLLLADYGFKLDNDIVVDTVSRLFGGDYFMPAVINYEPHVITSNFAFYTFFPYARSVEAGDIKPDGATVTVLAKTTPGEAEAGQPISWAERELDQKQVKFNPAKDRMGPIGLAAISSFRAKSVAPAAKPEAKSGEGGQESATKPEDEKEARIAVIGSSSFVKNRYFNYSGNGNFFLNVANWLAEEADLIAIQPKTQAPRTIQLTGAQGKFMGFFVIFLLSLPIRVLGVYISLRRRSL